MATAITHIFFRPLAWAPYATMCMSILLANLCSVNADNPLDGRRPIYLLSLPIFVAGSVGAALSKSLGALIATRTIQVLLLFNSPTLLLNSFLGDWVFVRAVGRSRDNR
jgi:MFS family permease